jgi:hypothetical protein
MRGAVPASPGTSDSVTDLAEAGSQEAQ